MHGRYFRAHWFVLCLSCSPRPRSLLRFWSPITWQQLLVVPSLPLIASALVMNFGIMSLGWYLGGMAVVSLVALFFFRESKDVNYEE